MRNQFCPISSCNRPISPAQTFCTAHYRRIPPLVRRSIENAMSDAQRGSAVMKAINAVNALELGDRV